MSESKDWRVMARVAMKQIRDRLGMDQASFARAIKQLVPDAPEPTAVSEWETGKRRVPADVLLAALSLIDERLPGTSVEILHDLVPGARVGHLDLVVEELRRLVETQARESDGLRQEVKRLKVDLSRRIDQLESGLVKQRQETADLRRHFGVRPRVSNPTPPAAHLPEPTTADLAGLERDVASLEDGMGEVGQTLHRRWDWEPSPVPPYTPAEEVPWRGLVRRVNILVARMIEVYSMVGLRLQDGRWLDDLDPSADIAACADWIRQSVRLLQEQVPEIRAKAPVAASALGWDQRGEGRGSQESGSG